MRRAVFFAVGIVIANYLVAIFLWPRLPEQMASHWNFAGEVDGYMPKIWGVLLVPGIQTLLLGLFAILPNLEPKKENLQKFRGYFDIFVILLMLFISYVGGLTFAWNLGARFDFGQTLLPALAILFFYIGILLSKAKQNWFVGIRTPWTLSSEIVWDKTHNLGGRLFKIAAVISLFGIFFKEAAFLFFLIPILVAAIYSVVYSYLEYQKLGKKA